MLSLFKMESGCWTESYNTDLGNCEYDWIAFMFVGLVASTLCRVLLGAEVDAVSRLMFVRLSSSAAESWTPVHFERLHVVFLCIQSNPPAQLPR